MRQRLLHQRIVDFPGRPQTTFCVNKLTYGQVFLHDSDPVAAHVSLCSVKLHDSPARTLLRPRRRQVMPDHRVFGSNANQRQQCRGEIDLTGNGLEDRWLDRAPENQGGYVETLDRDQLGTIDTRVMVRHDEKNRVVPVI